MARPSKTQIALRRETEVRVGKARESILEEFSKLLSKHLPHLVRHGVASTSKLNMVIADGKARLEFVYSTEVRDGASCTLDDGQEDLPGVINTPGEGSPAAKPSEPKPPGEPGEPGEAA